MNLEVKIDAEAVQQQLVSAIMNSAIGEAIEKAINGSLTAKTGGSWDSKTIVELAVQGAVSAELRKLAEEIVATKREMLREHLASKMTDESLQKFSIGLLDKILESWSR